MCQEAYSSTRLDQFLVASSLVKSRNRAQQLIKEGRVRVDGVVVRKSATSILSSQHIEVDVGDDYVSRGAYKLEGAFQAFRGNGLVDPDGALCLDIGASTGGFTEVLLRRGARMVIALDVGHDQLDSRLQQDARVLEMSGTNIRDCTPEDLPFKPQYVVSDVSFISLTMIIPVIAQLAAPNAHIVLLIKPQFEVGKQLLGKHGIVNDPALQEEVQRTICQCAVDNGLTVVSLAPSPIEGTHGNKEWLLYLRT